jgi:DNA-binding LacI/PurR family transcriptional regulator
MKRMAEICGVSEAAVSYTLRGKRKVNPQTRERILAVAEKYHYRPNALVRSIQKKQSMMVGVACNDFGHDYSGAIIRGIMSGLHARNYQALVINWDISGRDGRHVLWTMGERRVDGILMFPTEGVEPQTYLAEMRAFHAPMVLIDRKWPACEFDYVGSEDVSGGFAITEHLIKLGHRKIANIIPRSMIWETTRLAGFREAMLRYGIPLNPDWIVPADTYEEIQEQTRRLLAIEDRPTAIMCANDDAGADVLLAAHELGIKVPQELSVTGFADTPIARQVYPRLTTVFQNAQEIGRSAVELLFKRIDQTAANHGEVNISTRAENILVPTRLVVRESTAPPKQSG